MIVDLHVPEVDRIFHYADPGTLGRNLQVGDRVLVPFGHRPKVEGYVIGFSSPQGRTLKPVLALLDPEPLLSPAAVRVAHWMKEYYLCPLVQALQCFLPPGTRLRAAQSARPLIRKGYRVADPIKARAAISALSRSAPKQAAVLDFLLQAGEPVTAGGIAQHLGVSRAPLDALLTKGLVRSDEVRIDRNPVRQDGTLRAPLSLNADQARALRRVIEAMEEGRARRILLHGVTGSGKTEVYLQAIAHARSRGEGAILLVPEIALTEQTLTILEAAFGADLAVLHSRLSLGERYDQWQKIWRGEVGVVVGARSAIFAPVRRLGLIVIDEEHETSYKQSESPRYHAREVAWALAQQIGIPLLMGSATPSLESRLDQERGVIEAVSMPNRIDGRPLPAVHVVDMRAELLRGNRSMFSIELLERLERVFQDDEQALLFINRRGFASFLLCRECGHVPRCDHCAVSYTFHQPGDLRCHYCDTRRSVPRACPQCSGPYLRPFGGGTQRVEEELLRYFPTAKAIRMDVDTTARKGAHARILSAFSSGAYNVLIGTQMVAKGLHFPGVTVVGVMAADIGLHFPEFRAAERTFQLLTQVAGRAGRGERPGDVIVQTYAPEHYAVQAAAYHDYDGFARQELTYRQEAGYPPYCSLVRCLWQGEEEEAVIQAATHGRDRLQSFPSEQRPDIVGPCPAPLSKLKGRFRWHLLLRGDKEQVHAAARHVMHGEPPSGEPRLVVDVDPLSIL